jgi:hypothetical protein
VKPDTRWRWILIFNTVSVNENYTASNVQCRWIMNGTGCERKRTYPCYGGLLLRYLEEMSCEDHRRPLDRHTVLLPEVRNRCLLNTHQPSGCISKNENIERCETRKTKSIWYGEGNCSNWKLQAKGPMLTDLHDAVFSLSSHIAPHTPIPLLAFSESRFQFYRRVFSVNWLARWQ